MSLAQTYKQAFSPKNVLIAVSGNIGCGKSTLTRNLSYRLGYEPFYEPVTTNPYLDLFYSDPKKWAFSMQIWILMKRFRVHQQALWENKSTIIDRSPNSRTPNPI